MKTAELIVRIKHTSLLDPKSFVALFSELSLQIVLIMDATQACQFVCSTFFPPFSFFLKTEMANQIKLFLAGIHMLVLAQS
jgi:hypothetical protein